MNTEEKKKMMEEIIQVVEKHVAQSETNNYDNKEELKNSNKYGREFGISNKEMAKWKEEYKKMHVDVKTILEQVKNNPIDTSRLTASFDIYSQYSLLD